MIRMLFRLMRQGFTDLALNPWAQLFSLAAVVLVAFLSGLFLMALTTLNQQLGSVRGETAFQVYWHPGMDMVQIKEQWDSFHKLPDFSRMATFTPEQAMRDMGEKLSGNSDGLARDFSFLSGKSPLPATALVFFEPNTSDIDTWTAETTGVLKSGTGVSRVVTTPLRDELGKAWRQVSRYVMWPSVGFLALVLGLVVGNTVRLSLVARAHEIEILQLAGAHNWYIRLPLIISGAIIGLSGGAVATGLLVLVHRQIKDVLDFPPLLMEIQFPPAPMLIALVAVPTLMAALASWLAVRGH